MLRLKNQWGGFTPSSEKAKIDRGKDDKSSPSQSDRQTHEQSSKDANPRRQLGNNIMPNMERRHEIPE